MANHQSGWQPSGPWMMKFRNVVDQAFDEAAFTLLINDYFAPRTFAGISPPGFGKSHAFRLYEVIQNARMEDWLIDLLAAAHERRPKNQALADLATDLGLTLAGPRLNNPTGKALEDIIQDNAKFINLAVFRETLPLLEGRVCWVDVPGHGGTGFLVGPDLVLTNQHVIQPLQDIPPTARWQDVKCRFDYKQDINGKPLDQKKWTEIGLDLAKPIEHYRKPSPFDFHPALGDADPSETDSALLRLAEPVGDLPVGPATADAKAALRGWIDAATAPPSLAQGNQVFLLQHPKGNPLQLSIGTITAFNQRGTRVRYDANSKDGSSGSPVFDADLKLVALHHAHDPETPRRWNQAIPFDCVQKACQADGITFKASAE